MYGTREQVCEKLTENYPADEPLALLIWTLGDIHHMAEVWGQTASTLESNAVLEMIGMLPADHYLISGLSADDVADFLKQAKEDMREVTIPADLLARVVLTAEQALWQVEWNARDEGREVPSFIAQKLSDVGKIRDLMKS